MKLRDYFIRRLFSIVPTIIGLTLITFIISHIVPADPAIMFLGEHATETQIDEFRERMGLDRPTYVQYIDYLSRFLKGDFGKSLVTRHPVIEDIMLYLPATLELSLVSMIIGIPLGVLIGVITAVKKDTIVDYLARLFALIGFSTPIYYTSLICIALFYSRLGLISPGRISVGLTPPQHRTGMYLVDSLIAGDFSTFIDCLKHCLLPASILGSWMMAGLVRQTRASMLDSLKQNYVVAARARGIPERTIIFKHALRNALLPTVTLIGMYFGNILTGAVITETIFCWPGLGSYMLWMIMSIDFNAVVGGVAIFGICYTIANILTDLLYGFLDPRIRYG